MPVPLTGLGDTVGITQEDFVAAVTGCKRNLECSKLHLWKRERQHVLGKQGALCTCAVVCISCGICSLNSGGKAEE